MTIYPKIIKTSFWDDLANEFAVTRYLGAHEVGELKRTSIFKSSRSDEG